MNNDIIKSWRCWYTDSAENIIELNSINNTIADIPSKGLHAIKLWFLTEDSCRFISGNNYYIFHDETLLGKSSACVDQTDSIEEFSNNLIIKETSEITDSISDEIFNLMIDSIDPSL